MSAKNPTPEEQNLADAAYSYAADWKWWPDALPKLRAAVDAHRAAEAEQHHDSDQATIAATETLLAEYDADELIEGHERAEYLAEQLRELLAVAKRTQAVRA